MATNLTQITDLRSLCKNLFLKKIWKRKCSLTIFNVCTTVWFRNYNLTLSELGCFEGQSYN